MGLFLLAVTGITAVLFLLLPGRNLLHGLSLAASAGLLGGAGGLTREVLRQGQVTYPALGGFFYLDGLSAIILDIVLLLGFLVSVYSVGYLEAEFRHGQVDERRLGIYYFLMYAFMFTMMLALTVKNMGMMWIAIEATTLASAFLVGFYNDKLSVEAAWKYVIICSVGIAVALLGIIFLHLSSLSVLNPPQLLDWTALYDQAEALQSPILRLAFIFILVGFGTKAGLAPMHTWLPGAHSQAPSPISALLSGVLLNSALYGIIRTVAIVNKNLGSSAFTGRLLIAIGLLSMATAAIFILTQKEYKRLLAYSSIEHMGIIALAVGIFTPASIFGALLHMINHSLTKSMLFLSCGTVLQKYGVKEIARIRGVLSLLPVSGPVFLLGLFAIAGTPPFSVFSSELSIIGAVFAADRLLLGAVFILLLALVFMGMALSMFRMFYGGPRGKLVRGENNLPGTVVLMLLLAAIAVTGLYLPPDLQQLLLQAQQIIIGGQAHAG